MRRLGVHISIAGGLHLSLERAKALRCNTLQIFSHNPRGWAVNPIPEEDASKFKSLRLDFSISPVYIHTSYLINMASKNNELTRKSIEMLIIEMDRADAIGADYVILHAGSASRDKKNISIKRAIDALSEVAKEKQWAAGLLIENTAAKRGDISSTIIDLSEIVTRVKGSLISGVCIDTCHAFAAGYDISNFKGIRRIAREIEKYIGHDKVKLIHLNDSKGEIGSGLDRHAHIGLGKIGSTGLKKFIQYSIFKDIPLILETPKKTEYDDSKNLGQVRKVLKEKR